MGLSVQPPVQPNLTHDLAFRWCCGCQCVASNLPSRTRLVQQVVQKVGKSGGVRKWKKPGRISRPFHVMYGVVVPQSVKHALDLDTESGNLLWTDANEYQSQVHCHERYQRSIASFDCPQGYPSNHVWRHWKCLHHCRLHGENLFPCGPESCFQEGVLWVTLIKPCFLSSLC